MNPLAWLPTLYLHELVEEICSPMSGMHVVQLVSRIYIPYLGSYGWDRWIVGWELEWGLELGLGLVHQNLKAPAGWIDGMDNGMDAQPRESLYLISLSAGQLYYGPS